MVLPSEGAGYELEASALMKTSKNKADAQRFLDWTLSPETETKMRAVLENQPAEENGHHRYDPAQFGLRPDEVAASFANYCDRFGLTVPAAPAETTIARSAAAGSRWCRHRSRRAWRRAAGGRSEIR